MTEQEKYPVACEIRRQLGPMTMFMLGAHNLAADESSLYFRIECSPVIGIKIHLNSQDLYDITFFPKEGEIKVFNYIYADDMHQLIEDQTGLYTRL